VAADGGVPRVQVEQRPGLARRALADNFGREKRKEIIPKEILNMAMAPMRAGEVPTMPRDRIFRSSRLYASMFVLGCIAACAAMIFFQWHRPPAAHVISAVSLLVLLLAHRMIAARFHPSNWLVRLGDDGLFIHFRSYLNEHLSAEDPTVVFLPYPDVRSARMVRERTKIRDTNHAVTTQTIRWVELELGIDPAPPVAALATESRRPGVWEKRWYGRSATVYEDYPVRMQTPPFLRVKWQVKPRASVLLDGLRQRVEIAPEVLVSEDFSDLRRLPRSSRKSVCGN